MPVFKRADFYKCLNRFDWRTTESPSRLKEDLLDLIAGMQSRRMDEQRASLPKLPGLNNANPDILRQLSSHAEPSCEDAATLPDENFFEMLMRCQVVVDYFVLSYFIVGCNLTRVITSSMTQNFTVD